MKRIFLTVILAVIIVGFASVALAEIFAFNISGTVTNIYGDSSLLSETGIEPGSPFVGSFMYDSEAVPQSSEPGSAIYNGYSMSITIEGAYISQSNSPKIAVYNDYYTLLFGKFMDTIAIEDNNSGTITSNLPASVQSLKINFINVSENSTLPPFTNTDLPLTLDLQDFIYRIISIEFGDPGAGGTIEGEVISLQPTMPADSDSDGVFDVVDECPNTPENAIVYSNGCTKGDMDNDGDVDGDDLYIFSHNFGL